MNRTKTQQKSIRSYYYLALAEQQGILVSLKLLRENDYDMSWYDEMPEKRKFLQDVRALQKLTIGEEVEYDS